MEDNKTTACDCEKCVTEQLRTKSPTWWVGMVACVAQGVCAVLTASGSLSVEVSAAIQGAFAALFVYFNGNNPSIKGEY